MFVMSLNTLLTFVMWVTKVLDFYLADLSFNICFPLHTNIRSKNISHDIL